MTKYRTRRSSFRTLLRKVRYAVLAPDWVIQEDNECTFYSPFVPWGGLCFDIGANVGDKTHIFHVLGAKVISVEPLPSCVDRLRQRFATADVEVVNSALGAESGRICLYVGDDSTISSVLRDWIERNPTQLSGRSAVEEVDVNVTTLDCLIETHGVPDFCKIDVEGYEASVLRGLTMPIPSLSFEWTADTLESTRMCIEELRRLGDYEFNVSFASPLRFESGNWLDSKAVVSEIETSLCGRTRGRWGDVFARRRKGA